jgi:DNA-binding transcriptional regulator YiaG
MPNIANMLKAEVTRLARKELRAQTEGLKKTVATQRTEMAVLKRRLHELEIEMARMTRAQKKPAPATPTPRITTSAPTLRFRAAGMASNRKRLGLSAADFGRLVGATGQSVYAWEAGKSQPKSHNLQPIADLRGVGKREVATRLAALK